MANTAILNKPEDKDMARQKRQTTQWKEPHRRTAPTMTARAVANRLGFNSVEMVHVLVRRGPEMEGLPAYIPNDNGIGWRRKKVPTKAEREQMKAEGKPYNSHSGVQLMFYAEDVELWDKAHPLISREQEHIDYTEQERALVVQEAEKIKEGQYVDHTLLSIVLENEYGLTGRRKFRQILDDLGYKSYTAQERDLVIAEAERIKQPNGSVNRTQLLKALATRHNLHWDNGLKYQRLKQILDDENYPLAPEVPHNTAARRRYRVS